MTPYHIHDDYKKLKFRVPMHPFILPFLQIITRKLYQKQPVPHGITLLRKYIHGRDGHTIPIELFSPGGIAQDAPCLLFLHGGAFALPATGYHKKLICDYALGCSCKVLCVDYRLTPRYPYPYGLEDCYSAYTWLIDNAEEHHIDSDRIAICGDSAGGNLAAALTLMIRDRSMKMPIFQLLIYPVLDSSLSTDSMKQYNDTPIWNAPLNKKMWTLYIKHNKEIKNYEYASPLHAKSLNGLPKTYIEVSEFDCLRDEAITFYETLLQHGVDAIINYTKGTIHGFELNYVSTYTQEIIKNRIDYMNKQFQK